MHAPDPNSTPETPDPVTAHLDRNGLKDAHGRTGRMLQNAGLPFEEDEFEDEDDTTSSSGEGSSSTSGEDVSSTSGEASSEE